jgi:dolichol-phosphate mannosyltransferase
MLMDTPSTRDWRVRAADRFPAPLLRLISPEVLRFVRFGLVGGSGVLVNSLTLFLLHDEFALGLTRSMVVAITLAILNNFMWNNFWTFKTTGIQSRRLIQFVVISLIGMVVNVVVANLLVAHGMHYAAANLVGIALATAWNFYANVRWTWGDEAIA